jgi:hypothetical protein
MCKSILIAYCFVTIGTAGPQQTTASQLLERYTQTQAKARVFADTGVAEGEFILRDASRVFERRPGSCYYDGSRVHLRYWQSPGLKSVGEEVSVENGTTRAFLWDGKSWFEYRKEKNTFGKLFVASRDQTKAEMISLGYGGAPLIGVFLGDLEPVESVLRRAKTVSLRERQEQVEGSNCYVLEATTDHGQYTLWIDPQHGYNIARAETVKRGEDLAWGKPVGWVGDPSGPNWEKGPPDREKEIRFALSNVCFDQKDGVWVPVEATYEQTLLYVDGKTSTGKTHYKRTSLRLNPDFEAERAFVPDIPNGTRTWIVEAPGISYEWRDGKPQTIVDETFQQDLDTQVAALRADVNKSQDSRTPAEVQPDASAATQKTPDANRAGRNAPLAQPPADVAHKHSPLVFVGGAVLIAAILVSGFFLRAKEKGK